MGRRGFTGTVFCGRSTLKVGARAEGTVHVEELQATWNHEHIRKHSLGTLPFPALQPHEIFRLLDTAHPLLSPSASTLPYTIMAAPFLLFQDAEKGKIRPQPGGESVPTLWTGVGPRPNFSHNTPPTWEQYHPHGVALGGGRGLGKQNKERSLEDAGVQVPEGPWGTERCLGVMTDVFY